MALDDLSTLFLLLPDEQGQLVVCALDQVMAKVIEAEGQDRADLLESLAMNASIDSFSPSNTEAIVKVRRLNETGDTQEYWR